MPIAAVAAVVTYFVYHAQSEAAAEVQYSAERQAVGLSRSRALALLEDLATDVLRWPIRMR
ncbi:MAG: hypothetical protein KIT16_12335 [Rhodospirillaceae bacterium]|nr:hypothetical protein [Rhodospirillaceae bacterium]